MKFFSYKTIVVLFVLLALGGGVFALSYMKPAPSDSLVFEKNSANLLDALATEVANKDTDGDGLKDWEEALWKSDIQNPDTDGDGTRDGDEVREGRDPAKAAPGDEIAAGTPESISVATPVTPPTNNLSEILAQSFQPVYDVLNEKGDIQLSEEDTLYASLSKEFSERVSAIPKPDLYRFQDLSIIANPTNEETQGYIQAFRQISDSYTKKHKKNPLAIVNDAFRNGDGSELGELNAMAKTYRAVAKDLFALRTPINIAQSHLELVNTYNGMADAVEKMRKMQEDPLSGIVGITAYQGDIETLIVLTDSFNSFFSESNKSF